MNGIFDAYELWPFDKKLIFELVTLVNTCDFTVISMVISNQNTRRMNEEMRNWLEWFFRFRDLLQGNVDS